MEFPFLRILFICKGISVIHFEYITNGITKTNRLAQNFKQFFHIVVGIFHFR